MGISGEATDTVTSGLNSVAAITIAAFLLPNSLPAAFSTVVTKGNIASNRGYGLNIEGGFLNFVKINNVNVKSNVVLPTGTYNHVAVTWDGVTQEVKFYLGGVLRQTISSPGAITAPVDADPVVVGRYLSSASYYNGQIDELRIYNSALTGSEIATIATLAPPGAITGVGVITEGSAPRSGTGKVDVKGFPERRPFGRGTTQ